MNERDEKYPPPFLPVSTEQLQEFCISTLILDKLKGSVREK